MRASGEQMLLIRDWLAPGCGKASCLTSAQVTTLDANWSTWQASQDSPAQTWGNVGMPANNYFAGQFRNDFDFGVATSGENGAAATNLSYALNARWPDLLNFVSPTGTGKNGALGYGLHSQEGGGEYGRYSLNYYALAMSSAAVMGRDLWNETTAFQSGVLQTIYNTMLTPTTSRGMWDLFTWADDENWVNAKRLRICQLQCHGQHECHWRPRSRVSVLRRFHASGGDGVRCDERRQICAAMARDRQASGWAALPLRRYGRHGSRVFESAAWTTILPARSTCTRTTPGPRLGRRCCGRWD